jgi:hypothetical protein
MPLCQHSLSKHLELSQSLNYPHNVKLLHEFLFSFFKKEMLLIANEPSIFFISDSSQAQASNYILINVSNCILKTGTIKESKEEPLNIMILNLGFLFEVSRISLFS